MKTKKEGATEEPMGYGRANQVSGFPLLRFDYKLWGDLLPQNEVTLPR